MDRPNSIVMISQLLIFILLFSNFNSIKNSFLILLNIPLSLVGGIVALWLTGQNLSVPSSVGFIALFGIALENAMVLVTYFNQLLRDGLEIDEAAIKGAVLRLRPVPHASHGGDSHHRNDGSAGCSGSGIRPCDSQLRGRGDPSRH